MAESGGKPFEPVFSPVDPVGNIIGLQSGVSARAPDRDGSIAVVAAQLPGQFMFHTGQDLAPLPAVCGGQKRIFLMAEEITQIRIMQASPEVDVFQKLLFIDNSHHIADVFCVDFKDSFFLEIADIHMLPLFLS